MLSAKCSVLSADCCPLIYEHHLLLRQKLQLHPSFNRESIKRQSVLPDAAAQAKLAGCIVEGTDRLRRHRVEQIEWKFELKRLSECHARIFQIQRLKSVTQLDTRDF